MKVLFSKSLFIALFTVGCGGYQKKISLHEDTQANSENAQVAFGIHSAEGWGEKRVPFTLSVELSDAQRKGLLRAMHTWEIAVGKPLFEFRGDDSKKGDDFADIFDSLKDPLAGYYLNHAWDRTGKSNLVLATTIWNPKIDDPQLIDSADIHFNAKDYYFTNAYQNDKEDTDYREVVDTETLALHELGHLLGLTHVEEAKDSESVMIPAMYIGEGMANRVLGRGDIERIQKIYGCEGSSCDIDGVLKTLEDRSVKNLNEDTAARGST